MKTFLLKMPDRTHKDVKTNAAMMGISMTDYINAAVYRKIEKDRLATTVLGFQKKDKYIERDSK